MSDIPNKNNATPDSNDKTIEKIAIKFSSVVSLSFCYGPTPSVKSRIFTFF